MQPLSETKVFAGYRLNTDSADEALQPGEVRDARNMIEELGSGKITNMRGFDDVMSEVVNWDFTLPSGTFKLIGSTYDVESSRIIYLLCDTTGTNHSIMLMNLGDKSLEWVLKVEPYLNFQSDHRVRCKVLNGTLYWTDGYEGTAFVDYNPPRKLSIARAMAYTEEYYNGDCATFDAIDDGSITGSASLAGKMAYRLTSSNPFVSTTNVVVFVKEGTIPGIRYKEAGGYATVLGNYGGWLVVDLPWVGGARQTKSGHVMRYSADRYSGIDWQTLDLITYPPEYAPAAEYGTDEDASVNKLRNKLFQFCYRYKYLGNERSVWSPISDIPLPLSPELLNGSYDESIIADNLITVTMNSGSLDVSEIELAVREGNTGVWKIIHREYKYDQDGEILLAPDIEFTYNFTNNEIGEGLDQSDTARPFDHVPQLAGELELIEKNRLLLADYTEGFNNVDIEATLTHVAENINIGNIADGWGYSEEQGLGSTIFTFSDGTSNDYYWIAKLNLRPIFEAGYVYIISINANQYKYQNAYNTVSYTEDYLGKTIQAVAIVDVDSDVSYKSFINSIISQIRYGSLYSAVIAFCNPALTDSGYNLWGGYTSGYPTGVNTSLTDDEIGIVTDSASYGITPLAIPYVWQNIYVSVYRIERDLYKQTTFKGGFNKTLGVSYIDRAGRTGMVNDAGNIYIPHISELGVGQFKRNFIQWKINNTPPIEAVYYQWYLGKNTSSTYYCQAVMVGIGDANASDCIYVDVNTGIARSKEVLPKFNISAYEWQKGDRLRFVGNKISIGQWAPLTTYLDFEIVGTMVQHYDDGVYELGPGGDYLLDAAGNKIIKERSQRLMIKSFNYASYSIYVDRTIVEIYRPAPTGENIIYHAIGEKHPILDPHTASRRHSGDLKDQSYTTGHGGAVTLVGGASGMLTTGDAYMFLRLMSNVFPAESAWYSDYFASEDISIGRPNVVDRTSKRQHYESNLRYGGRYIQDTQINDVPTFMASDFIALPVKYGAIYSIVELSTLLKILQVNKSSSLYIGRAGLTQPSESAKQIITSTKDVLGTLDHSTSDFGTVHPGSAIRFEGKLYSFDFYATAICRDAGNGIQDIADYYKIKTTIRDYCALWGTPDNVDVVSAIDQDNSLVIWTFIDKTTPSNSMTIAFRDTGGRNQDGFIGPFDFIPDEYGVAKRTLTSWKNNKLWLHGSSTVNRCDFYGVTYPYSVTMVFNKMWDKVKRFLQILVASPKVFAAPDAGDISIPVTGNNPSGMVSLLKAGAFRSVQGKFVAEFGKNMTTHQTTASIADLVNGDDLQGQAMTVKLEANEATEHSLLSVELRGVISEI